MLIDGFEMIEETNIASLTSSASATTLTIASRRQSGLMIKQCRLTARAELP